MIETLTINRDDWLDIVKGKTGNPVVEADILKHAQDKELLIDGEGGQRFFPKEDEYGKWQLIEVWSRRDVATRLNIAPYEAFRLFANVNVPVTAVRKRQFFDDEELFDKSLIESSLHELAGKKGLTKKQAALELGISDESFDLIARKIPFNTGDRFLRVFLEEYRNRFLPRDRTWSSRTSLLLEFIENYNKRGESKLAAQYCEVDGCSHHLASSQCANLMCRSQKEGRYLCPAHEVWIDSGDIANRPSSLCPTCAAQVEDGTLEGFKLL